MSRAFYGDTFLIPDAVTGATSAPDDIRVFVYDRGTTDEAVIYTAETGNVVENNPFLTVNGAVEFWAEPGSYDIFVEDSLGVPRIAPKTIAWDSVPGSAGGIPTSMIALDNLLGAGSLAPDSVGASEIIAGAVGNAELDAGSVSLAKLAAAVAEALVPAGALIATAQAGAPTGYLLCDGAAVSRSTYAALFAAIGTAYGAGDLSTTFNLPNLKGKVPTGRDAAQAEFDALGETGGSKTTTLTVNEMPNHAHPATVNAGQGFPVALAPTNETWDESKLTPDPGGTRQAATLSAGNGISSATQTGGIGSGQAFSNLPPYTVVNFIIKT